MVSYVVTGSNRGIGFAFIKYISANPQNIVFALTRNKATSTDLLNLASQHTNVHVLQADITDVPALRAVAKAVEDVTGGTLDVLINNGAYLGLERSEYTLEAYDGKDDLLEEDFGNFFRVNVLGVIKTTNVFLPLLRKASQSTLAKVITISSANGDMEFNIQGNVDFFVPYSVSKAAGNMVMAKYAARFKNDNFLFLSLCPGFVNTTSNYTLPLEALEGHYKKYTDLFKKAFPDWRGTLLTPEESVTGMMNTISKLSPADSGKFITYAGDTKTWL